MTQEDKDLLLRDLSARLTYGVKVFIQDITGKYSTITERTCDTYVLQSVRNKNILIKPYLRPMSSMTEEEKSDFPFPYYFDWIDSNFSLLCSDDEVYASIGFDEMYEIIDWLNAHHFDYRGLIKKGLAIAAPEGMYNLEKK